MPWPTTWLWLLVFLVILDEWNLILNERAKSGHELNFSWPKICPYTVLGRFSGGTGTHVWLGHWGGSIGGRFCCSHQKCTSIDFMNNVLLPHCIACTWLPGYQCLCVGSRPGDIARWWLGRDWREGKQCMFGLCTHFFLIVLLWPLTFSPVDLGLCRAWTVAPLFEDAKYSTKFIHWIHYKQFIIGHVADFYLHFSSDPWYLYVCPNTVTSTPSR